MATPLPSIVDEVEHVHFAADVDAFVTAVEGALEPAAQDSSARDQRTRYALQFSWDSRTDQATAAPMSAWLRYGVW